MDALAVVGEVAPYGTSFTASGEGAVAVQNNTGIISTGSDATIQR
ncbi:hypothetical protein ACWF94_33765 [Streptomyces sp. NPDC055078]